MPNTIHYAVGGAVQSDAGIYIRREADRRLLDLCRERRFGYILTTRQVGKTSLIFNTMQELRREGIRSIYLGLTEIGVADSADIWYRSMLRLIAMHLGLYADIDVGWDEYPDATPVNRFIGVIRDVVLMEVEEPLVVFIDEIDLTNALKFNTDDFYMAIRSIYGSRDREPRFQRISFVLVGSATPMDLLRDPRQSPFNIGERIDLTYFTAEEASSLAIGLSSEPAEGASLLERVLHWTSGHPYLTCLVCGTIRREREKESWSRAWRVDDVDRVVSGLFFGGRGEHDHNIFYVAAMLAGKSPDQLRILKCYQKILKKKRVVDDIRPTKATNHLKIAGIIRRDQGKLVVANRIYQHVFDRQWLTDHWPREVRLSLRTTKVLGVVQLFLLAVITITLLGFQDLRTKKNEKDEEIKRKNDTVTILNDTINGLKKNSEILRGKYTKDFGELHSSYRGLEYSVDSLEKIKNQLIGENHILTSSLKELSHEKTADSLETLSYRVSKNGGRDSARNILRLLDNFIIEREQENRRKVSKWQDRRIEALERIAEIDTGVNAVMAYDTALDVSARMIRERNDTLLQHLKDGHVDSLLMVVVSNSTELEDKLARHAHLWSSLAHIHRLRTDRATLDVADSLYRMTIRTYKVLGDSNNQSIIYNRLAEISVMRMSDETRPRSKEDSSYAQLAESYLKNAIALDSGKAENVRRTLNNLDLLAEVYEKKGSFDSAIIYHKDVLMRKATLDSAINKNLERNMRGLSRLFEQQAHLAGRSPRDSKLYDSIAVRYQTAADIINFFQWCNRNSDRYIRSLDTLFNTYRELGNIELAKSVGVMLYEEYEDQSVDSPKSMIHGIKLAEIYETYCRGQNEREYSAVQCDSARLLFSAAYRIAQGCFKNAGKDSLQRRQANNGIHAYGQFLRRQFNYDDAQRVFNEWLGNARSLYGSDIVQVGPIVNYVADYYSEMLAAGVFKDSSQSFRLYSEVRQLAIADLRNRNNNNRVWILDQVVVAQALREYAKSVVGLIKLKKNQDHGYTSQLVDESYELTKGMVNIYWEWLEQSSNRQDMNDFSLQGFRVTAEACIILFDGYAMLDEGGMKEKEWREKARIWRMLRDCTDMATYRECLNALKKDSFPYL